MPMAYYLLGALQLDLISYLLQFTINMEWNFC